jgi:hypothetical protein
LTIDLHHKWILNMVDLHKEYAKFPVISIFWNRLLYLASVVGNLLFLASVTCYKGKVVCC